MNNLQEPFLKIQLEGAKADINAANPRVLLVGEASGTVTDRALVKNVTTRNAADVLGKGSMLHRAYLRFRVFNPITPVDCICLAQPSGAKKAAGGITIGGSATSDGEIRLIIADYQYQFSVPVYTNETAEQISQKIQKTIDDADVPYIATTELNPARVKIEYLAGGTIGNGLNIDVFNDAPGVTTTATGFTGGSGVYQSEGLFDNLDERYHLVAYDAYVDPKVVAAFLDSRFNVPNGLMSGNSITMINGAYDDFTKLSEDIRLKTSGETTTIFANCEEFNYTAIPLFMAAEFAAKSAMRLTDGADLKGIVVYTGGLPPKGGLGMRTKPYHNTPMSYGVAKGKLKTTEATNLYDLGFSLMVEDVNNKVVLGRVCTFNNSLPVYKFLCSVQAATASKEFFFREIEREYPQARLSSSDQLIGEDTASPATIKATLSVAYQKLKNLQIVSADGAAYSEFEGGMIITVDSPRMLVLARFDTRLVGQFRGLDAIYQVDLELSTNQ